MESGSSHLCTNVFTLPIAVSPDEESSRVLSLLCDVFRNSFFVLN